MPHHPEHIAVNDLLGKPPGWLLRSGISLVFVIVLSGLLLSAFIHYPDRLNGQVVIQRERTPVALVPTISTFIDSLFVEDGDEVKKGDIVAILHSDANWQEMMALSQVLESNSEEVGVEEFTELGALQSLYGRWMAIKREYAYYAKNNPTAQNKENIRRDIKYNGDLVQTTRDELDLLDRQIALEKNDYERQRGLAKEGVISIQELEEKEKRWLGFQQQRETLHARLIEYQLRINNLNQQIEKLVLDNKDRFFELEQSYRQLTEELSGRMQEWKDTYLLRATIAGQIIFSAAVDTKQQVSSSAPLLYVEPTGADQTTLLAKISIPATGLGKITTGDRLIIRLDAYPEKEYGTISTQVDEIRAMPSVDKEGGATYQVIAALREPVETTYNKELPLSLQMTGTATIITKDRSILSRVFEQLLSLINQN
jgi:HlyD family secretion protein